MPTILAAGDLAIIGINAESASSGGNTDTFNFVLLVDIEAGTQISFTDRGVLGDGSLRNTAEGIVTYTAPIAISAGTVIQFSISPDDISTDFVESGSFALALDGDQVIAFQGNESNPTFIYAAQTNSTQFQTNSDDANQSDLPPGLTVGTTAVALGAGPGPEQEFDNSTYIGITTGTREELLAAISDPSNWTGSNTAIPGLQAGPFTVISPDTTAPTVTLTSNAAGLVNAPFSVTATFSEPTSDFTATDITVTNGSISNFTGSGTSFTFDVIPAAGGSVDVDIADGVATDAAGNGNIAATTLSRTFDPPFPVPSPGPPIPNNENGLTPISANNLLEVTNLGAANTVELNIGQFGFDTISQIAIFSTDASALSRTEIGRISVLQADNLPNTFSPVFTISSESIAQGNVLQFELLENGQTRIATAISIDAESVELDFGDGDRITASLTTETSTTNLSIDDASEIDLTGLDGQTITIEYSVHREADFDNTLRFYRTDFADGGIITDPLTGGVIRPGEAGYEQVAIAQQLDIEITGQNNQVSLFSSTIEGGSYLGAFLIVDGTDPTTNEVYFSHAGANSDGLDRTRLLGNNTFGFEDLPNLGDRDFDDVVVEFSII